MNKLDCYQQLHRIFSGRKTSIKKATLAEKLECSERTIERYLDDMRDLFQAPLVYNQNLRGWHYDPELSGQFELPGLWLTASDIQSLFLLLEMLNRYSHGAINEELASISDQIKALLKARGVSYDQLQDKIRILPQGQRVIPDHRLSHCLSSLLDKRRLNLSYQDFNGNTSQREISPQRLIYYRDNWYLDAYCHLRNSLRSFALARINQLSAHKTASKAVAPEQLDEHFRQGYGVFAGVATHTAVLRCLPPIAHDIAQQQWHSQQQGEWQGQDYLLSLPYSDHRELILDILKYTPNITVEAPAELQQQVRQRLEQGLNTYQRAETKPLDK